MATAYYPRASTPAWGGRAQLLGARGSGNVTHRRRWRRSTAKKGTAPREILAVSIVLRACGATCARAHGVYFLLLLPC